MREPFGRQPRPTDEMHQPNPAHPTHDLTRISAHAAGDLPGADLASVQDLLVSCADCADLHRDLVAIATATHQLPAPISRMRDFQLEPEQAERLRRGSWLRAALRPFGTARSAARPLAAACTTLGIAGLLVAASLPGLAGGAMPLAPESGGTRSAGQPIATSASVVGPGAPAPQAGGPTAASGDYGAVTSSSSAPQASDAAGKAGPSTTFDSVTSGGAASGSENRDVSGPRALAASSPPNLLAIGSIALLTIGLLLFGLRFAGRRVR